MGKVDSCFGAKDEVPNHMFVKTVCLSVSLANWTTCIYQPLQQDHPPDGREAHRVSSTAPVPEGCQTNYMSSSYSDVILTFSEMQQSHTSFYHTSSFAHCEIGTEAFIPQNPTIDKPCRWPLRHCANDDEAKEMVTDTILACAIDIEGAE